MIKEGQEKNVPDLRKNLDFLDLGAPNFTRFCSLFIQINASGMVTVAFWEFYDAP